MRLIELKTDMRSILILAGLFVITSLQAQVAVNLPQNTAANETKIEVKGKTLQISWPSGSDEVSKIVLSLKENTPLFKEMGVTQNGDYQKILEDAQPEFLLRVGKRTLKAEKGWRIFFDKVPTRPYQTHHLVFKKGTVNITKNGKRTVVSIGSVTAPDFEGTLELTIYNDSPLVNIAAVVSTPVDASAILYDAGILTDKPFETISFTQTDGAFIKQENQQAASQNEKVKYRTILGSNGEGSLAVFPAPHQYFYPLDEAFNLAFVWHGSNYANLFKGNGIGIRQEPEGDKRFVPWFNAPPNTQQRLNFFCMLSADDSGELMNEVKKLTHSDSYAPLEGYKTLASHFHNEYVMTNIMKGKDTPENREFVDVFKNMGVNIVHQGEFHYTAHPKGPDSLRLKELKTLFDLCDDVSDSDFLMLPGEEPNEFLGGHWMAFFPRPVYWVMDRKEDVPFVTDNAEFGKVYHIRNEQEMQELLELEQGLAWTAHPRIKGSTGYPDAYKNKEFFKSDRFFGGAWKAMPADLSEPKIGLRVLNLLNDMNNWGMQKKILAESDLFTITKENEMYAHMNINYVALDKLPDFKGDWSPILEAMSAGSYFSTTGEIRIPAFSIEGVKTGETLDLSTNANPEIKVKLDWTFPLSFVDIISGDGVNTYSDRIDMSNTAAFGSESFKFSADLKDKTWVRFEVWDVAANGAFTQTIYLKN